MIDGVISPLLSRSFIKIALSALLYTTASPIKPGSVLTQLPRLLRRGTRVVCLLLAGGNKAQTGLSVTCQEGMDQQGKLLMAPQQGQEPVSHQLCSENSG